ncbi:MAG: AAA family ATPase [Cyanobacteriota bacterium]|nr:AAA family ATPase [Cyanobacteriota bacterium]
MVSIPGYSIKEQLYNGSRTLVYRAVRENDEKPVVIKFLKNAYPNFNELLQFRNQYTISKNLDIPGIIRPYSLEAYQNSYALVMEDFGGVSLHEYIKKENITSLEDVLLIGLQITDILYNLHQNHVIHKDIKPANILINSDTKQIKLIDFSIASLLPKETQEIKNPNGLEGTLAYISPEQTGRMNRGIDYRSDFYSLGVTLFELFTGELPFKSDDVMELVHCHIANTPPAMNKPHFNSLLGKERGQEIKPHPNPLLVKERGQEIRQKIPQVLSDIVMKLMAKNAEDRYQSALGLKSDLEVCLEQFQETGDIEYFEIAQRDICDRFIIPEKLYGRETEVQELLVAFERVREGNSELMLVAGFSGIGKTVVVNEVHKPIVKQRGYFIKGKFDQFNRNIPFSAFLQALRDLIGQLLSESDAQLLSWKNQILQVLGGNAQVIIGVIPDLEQVIGKQPPVPELSGSSAENRFNSLFKKFIQVFTTKEHPLVIFLDDLQWADSASLKLMQLLMSESGNAYLLLIGAYRDNEVFPAHPLMLTVEEIDNAEAVVNTITLAPLNEISLNQLVADTLNCLPLRAEGLTQLIHQKTKGNPFFSTQFLKSLYEDGLIKFNFDDGFWQCDISEVIALALTDDVVEFMGLQLKKLPQSNQNILKLAACIGNKFDLTTLAIVCEKPEAEAAVDLWKALQVGLILPQSEVYKFYIGEQQQVNQEQVSEVVNYKFLHDRVQQAAYSLIPDDEKQATHLKIGQLLLEQTSESEREEKLFDIVNHSNIGKSLITQASECWELAQLNLEVGRKAKSATAYSAAIAYFKTGIELLEENCWESQYALTLALHEAKADAIYLNGNFEQLDAVVNVTLQSAKTLLDKIAIYETQIQAYLAQNKLTEAINTGVDILKKLGIHLPQNPNMAQILLGLAKNKLILAGKKTQNLVNLPTMTNQEKLAAMRILSCTLSAVFSGDPKLLPLLVFQQVNLSVQYGNIPLSAFAYAWYGSILCGVLVDIDKGHAFGQLSLQILERFHAKNLRSKTLFAVNGFTAHWKHHLKFALPNLQEAYQIGVETGDLEYAAWSACLWSIGVYWVGRNLSDLEQALENYAETVEQWKQNNAFVYINIHRQSALNLMGQTPKPSVFEGLCYSETDNIPIQIAAGDRTGLFIVYVNQLQLRYLFDELEGAIKAANLAKQYEDGGMALFTNIPLYLYDSLTKLALYSTATKTERLRLLRQVSKNQKKLKKWANFAPMNSLHKWNLVEAERYQVLGKHTKAITCYDCAISGAKENGYLQDEALANELAAKFYLNWDKEKVAAVYMQEAYYCYSRWGAKAKTDDLEKRYPQLLTPILQTQKNSFQINETQIQSLQTIQKTHSSSSFSEALDFTSLIKSTQALSSEIQLEDLISTLLQIVIENAGAEKAALIYLKNNTFTLEAIAIKDLGVTYLSIPYETSKDIPNTVINYVKHSLKTVFLDNATFQNDFVNDEYLIQHKPKSLLCTPIINKGELTGLIYLENKLTIGSFTKKCLEVIDILCSQAAISLENSRLYQQSQSYGEQLEESIYNLQQVQNQLIEDEKSIHMQVEAMLELSQNQAISLGDLIIALQELTEKTALTLQVERVSIWLFDDEMTKIQCVDLFEQTSGCHSKGLELLTIEYPNYFAAISSEPILAVNDAQRDIKTDELTDNYLRPLNIASMLDSSVQINGAMGGLICCEKVGSKRIWTKAEQNFIRSIANLIALAIESNKRHQKAEKLQQTLSELNQAQLQMVQNEKMATLGNLVAGVAHEVNNPIGFLKGSISNAEEYIQDLLSHIECYQENYPEPEEEVIENAEDIDLEYLREDLPKLLNSMKLATERITDISNSLRTFSRADTSQKIACNVHEGIDSTILILKYRLKANDKRPAIKIIKQYGELPLIKCFLGQLNQVFMNIIANAIDALDSLSEGKTFSDIEANPHQIILSTKYDENNTVTISIKDNGSGIPESIRKRIFDNLFTTKGVGKGTGLGLAIAKQIIEETHNGKLSCNSVVEKGTEFVIELPIES